MDTYNYSLKLWIDSNAGNEVINKVFRSKINIVGNQVITDKSSFATNGNVITGYNFGTGIVLNNIGNVEIVSN